MLIPKPVKDILKKLEQSGFTAFVVGGCVRDLLLKKEPNDWDIATNAKPNEVEKLFKKTFKINKFGTVTVQTESKKKNLKEVEITTFRTEEKYTDKRHPDEVRWANTIEEDLARRDFTVNAIAISLPHPTSPSQREGEEKGGSGHPTSTGEEKGGSGHPTSTGEEKGGGRHPVSTGEEKGGGGVIVDPFGGQKDLEKKIIRAVGNPEERFKEDALRLIRAVRFAVSLDFEIEKETKKALKKLAGLLEFISDERIRDEFVKIIMTRRASQGIEVLRENNLLKHIIPELLEGYKVGQNKHHIYDVYEHSVRSLDYAAKKDFNKYVRIAALLHDVGKPRTKEGEGVDSTFYNHEIVGAKMTSQILQRLRFPKKDIEKIVKLVRYHLFYYNVDEVGDASVRRLVRRLGRENLEELVQLRMCDRIGSGCPKALPYKLRHFQYIAEKVGQDAIDETMLKIGGKEIMEFLEIKPGPKIGNVLSILLGEVLDEPKKNTKDYLEGKVKELKKLDDKGLNKLAKQADKKRNEIVEKRDEMTKKKYWVS